VIYQQAIISCKLDAHLILYKVYQQIALFSCKF